MRYTSEAIMDEKGLRDVERWKDKIEVRLDNRQVAFLFFGSALVACLLFVLGVIVGKRIESRGHAVAPEIEDPLALLDRVASTEHPGSEGLTLSKTGLGLPTKAKAVTVAPAPIAAAPKPVASVKAAPPLAPKKMPAPTAIPTTSAKTTVATVVPTPAPSPPASAPSLAAIPPPAANVSPSRGKGRFTLQIKAFPNRPEAETLAQKLGHGAYVVPAEIPGKGTWFRVRMGDYGSFKEVIAAKAAFEKQTSMIGLVVGPM